jgi:hypothetical protein
LYLARQVEVQPCFNRQVNRLSPRTVLLALMRG